MKKTVSTPVTPFGAKAVVYLGHSAPTTPDENTLTGAAYVLYVTRKGRTDKKSASVARKGKTGNLLDLSSMVLALRSLKEASEIEVVTTNKYLVTTSKALQGYIKAGWKTRTGEDVKNKEAWQCLLETAEKAGHKFSVRMAAEDSCLCDLCKQEAAALVARERVKAYNKAVQAAKAKPAPEQKASPAPEQKATPAPEKKASTPASRALQQLAEGKETAKAAPAPEQKAAPQPEAKGASLVKEEAPMADSELKKGVAANAKSDIPLRDLFALIDGLV